MLELDFGNGHSVMDICEGYGVSMALDTVGDGQVH